jgi:hypothetical protein
VKCTNLVELVYLSDDEITAVCDYFNSADTYCGFALSIGYRPGLQQVVEAQQKHDQQEGP